MRIIILTGYKQLYDPYNKKKKHEKDHEKQLF